MSTLVAGIDECGYGPLLGPLVIGSSIFLIKENPEKNMWLRLQDSIGKNKKGLDSRLLITDSKKAWNRKAKINHLERTTGAFMNYLLPPGCGTCSIVPTICNDLVKTTKTYPWYSSMYNSQLPEISSAGNALIRNMENNAIDFLGFRNICIDVLEFNQLVESTGNKATVVSSSMLKLISHVILMAKFYSTNEIIIYCDRLGGRAYYKEILQKINNTFKVAIITESSRLSKYVLSGQGLEISVQFEVGADDKHLPVALASMVAKYIREKVVEHMNKYFKMLQPNLKATAGYWTDGLRFLRDIEESGTLYASGIDIKSMRRIK